ncbi:chorismate-binding protein [Candidatus Berkiella cookevillensis]|uniref:anthranilate synthase n=1 Tax=Candidatus Berkiella cookevillensis TaxID=437022 RepID=A0A0Q9YLL9_9GAMM|nr:chorismate-binding protein [Candidatus Berkiella cookevillensis]MCS5708179.1 chorismate-binding protein [Candidatus Berkiella cookevillensis]
MKQRTLNHKMQKIDSIDALSLYAQLTNNGRKANSLLFSNHEKDDCASFIISQSALKIEYIDKHLIYHALTPFGEQLIQDYFQLQNLTKQYTIAIQDHAPLSFIHPALEKINQFIKIYKVKVAILFSFEFYDCIESLPTTQETENNFPQLIVFVPELYFEIKTKTQICLAHFNSFSNNTNVFENIISKLAEPQKTHLLTKESTQKIEPTLSIQPNDSEFIRQIATAKQNIQKGNVYQIVLSRAFSLPCPNPFASFEQLRKSNPTAYQFYYHCDHFIVFGASPETSIKVENQNNKKRITLHPIAGTKPRGFDHQKNIATDIDVHNEKALLSDPKELAEHMMLVDLARNDISKIAIAGTTKVTALTQVSKHSEVMHLYSIVEGELPTTFDCIHAFSACLNMGTLSGAPKLKATKLIKEIEQTQRGAYGGAIGWIAADETCDTAIIIRSACVQNGIATIRAGAGIVFDSDPKTEVTETYLKAKTVINAI